MGNNINDNVDKFLKYMSRPLSLPALDLIYTSNNIVFERVDMYCDFILTLNDVIFTTYLGDDFTSETERVNHFNWCWNSVSNKLIHGKITFKNNEDAYIYFLNFYFDTFYNADKKDENTQLLKMYKIWKSIFDYNIEKPRTDLDTFLTLYRVFEKTYQK